MARQGAADRTQPENSPPPHDLALLYLNASVHFNERVRPACLPEVNSTIGRATPETEGTQSLDTPCNWPVATCLGPTGGKLLYSDPAGGTCPQAEHCDFFLS
jgi:hypothetical protein